MKNAGEIAENRMMRASIVVLSYNRIEELRNTAPLVLQEAGASSAEVIFVDNDSSDGSADYLESIADGPDVKVLRMDSNLGVAGGRNAGYEIARGEYIINLDDDTYVFPGLVAQTAAAFERFQDAGILAFRVRHHVTDEDQNPHGEEPCEVANFHGAGHAFRRALFASVGYLDKACTFGGEELEMSIRARCAGFGVKYVPDIVVEHNSIRRPGKVHIDRLVRYRYSNTRLLFMYFPAWTATVFSCRLGFGHFVLGFRFGFRPWAKLWQAWLCGCRDGLSQRRRMPKDVLAFYMNPDLRPEYGNVPFSRKILRRFRRSGPAGT